MYFSNFEISILPVNMKILHLPSNVGLWTKNIDVLQAHYSFTLQYRKQYATVRAYVCTYWCHIPWFRQLRKFRWWRCLGSKMKYIPNWASFSHYQENKKLAMLVEFSAGWPGSLFIVAWLRLEKSLSNSSVVDDCFPFWGCREKHLGLRVRVLQIWKDLEGFLVGEWMGRWKKKGEECLIVDDKEMSTEDDDAQEIKAISFSFSFLFSPNWEREREGTV